METNEKDFENVGEMAAMTEDQFYNLMGVKELLTPLKDEVTANTDFNALPDDFSGFFPGCFSNLHFKNAPREILHQHMVQLGSNLQHVSPEKKRAFYRYLRTLTGGQPTSAQARNSVHSRSSLGTVSTMGSFGYDDTVVHEKLDRPIVSCPFFFTNWNTVTQLMLSFLLPHEALYCISSNTALYEGFYSDSCMLKYTELILTTPFHKCCVKLRRRIFSRFYGIRILRIEPVVASVFVQKDLECIIQHSVDTLERLYICCPCAPLLFNLPSSNNPLFPGNDTTELVSATTDNDRIFLRCQEGHSDGNTAELGCRFYWSDSPNFQDNFQSLTHIELTGNDSFLWAIALQEWDLPAVTSLTLQTWTSNFTSIEEEFGILSPPLVKKHFSTCVEGVSNFSIKSNSQNNYLEDPGDLSWQQLPNCCAQIIKENHEIFWKRTSQCLFHRLTSFTRLLMKVEVSLEELELVVPGRTGVETQKILPSGSGPDTLLGNIENQDKLFGLDENINDCVSMKTTGQDKQINTDSTLHLNAYKYFIKRQFDGLVRLLRDICFRPNGMPHLEKIQFLGLVSFTPSIHVLTTVLTEEFQEAQSLLRQENKNKDTTHSSLPERSQTGGFDSQECLPPSFDIEPGQPVLPILDFEDNLDKLCAVRPITTPEITQNRKKRLVPRRILFPHSLNSPAITATGTNSGLASVKITPDHTERILWPCKEAAVFARCLIIFSGVLHLPEKSCVEFKTLYPDCISNYIEKPLLLSSQSVEDKIAIATGSTEYYRSSNRRSSAPNAETVLRHSKSNMYNGKTYTMKIRLQQESPAFPPREFQRLQLCVAMARNRYLQPVAKVSNKGKLSVKKKQILTLRDAPQDVSLLLREFAAAITNIEIFFGNPTTSIRQFSAMHFASLETIRLVNWNGGTNRSHLTLFGLTQCRPKRLVRLAIETTDSHYEKTRKRKAKEFYSALMQFVKLLQSRGMLVDRISLFPGPEPGIVACMNYIFPVSRLHLAAVPQPFFDQLEKYQVPACLLTFFLSYTASSTASSFRLDTEDIAAGRHSDHDNDNGDNDTNQNKQYLVPPVVAINNEITEISAPLERGYTHIREFLVQEVERRQRLGAEGDYEAGKGKPSPSSLSVAWGGTVIAPTTASAAAIILSEFKQSATDLAQQAKTQFLSGSFFSHNISIKPIITLSCTRGLANFYEVVLAFRTFSMCTLTEGPYESIKIIMRFDVKRYGLLDMTVTDDPMWFVETLFIPWLTLSESVPTVTHCVLALLDVPTTKDAAKSLFHQLEMLGEGFGAVWAEQHRPDAGIQDAIIVLLNPKCWSSKLCKWVVTLAAGKIGESNTRYLRQKGSLI